MPFDYPTTPPPVTLEMSRPAGLPDAVRLYERRRRLAHTRLEICQDCPHQIVIDGPADACELLTRAAAGGPRPAACLLGRYLQDPGAVCPAGSWPAEEP